MASSPEKRRAELEKIIKRKRYSPERADIARSRLEQLIEADREQRVQTILEKRAQAQAESPTASAISKVTGPVLSGLAGAAKTGSLGFVDDAAAALTAPVTAIREGVGLREGFRQNRETANVALDALSRTSPAATTAGEIGGFFTGAPGAIGRAGATVAGPVARFAARQGGQSFTRRAASQIAANLVGGGTSIAGVELLQDSDKGLGERLDTIREQITSPANLLLSGVTGGISAKFRSAANADAQRAARAFRRIGVEPTADVARGGTALGRNIQEAQGTLGNLPGGFGIRQRYMRGVVRGVQTEIDRIQDVASGGQTAARGAQGVRDVAGVGRRAQGRVTRLRRGIQSRAFQEEGANEIGVGSQRAIRGALANFIGEGRSRGDVFSSEMTSVLRSLDSAIDTANRGSRSIDIQTVENIRQRIGAAAKIGNSNPELISLADRRLMTAATDAISNVYAARAPRVAQAMTAGRWLRDVQERLGGVAGKVPLDDDETILKLLRSKNFQDKWNAMERFATPTEVQGVRGRVLAMLTDRASRATAEGQVLTTESLRSVMRSQGFSRNTLSRILSPEVMDSLDDLGRVGSSVMSGIGQARNSATGTRIAGTAALAAASGSLILGASLLRDGTVRENALLSALGTAGVWAFAASMVNGNARNSLNRLATGGATLGPTTGAALVQQRSPTDDLSSLASGGTSGVAQGLSALLRGAGEKQ